MIEYTKIKRMEKNKMREINLKTIEAVTYAAFSKIKINDNVPPTIVDFLSSCKNRKQKYYSNIIFLSFCV